MGGLLTQFFCYFIKADFYLLVAFGVLWILLQKSETIVEWLNKISMERKKLVFAIIYIWCLGIKQLRNTISLQRQNTFSVY